MIIENVNIYDLIPSQIVDLIQKLLDALTVVKGRKSTISKVTSYEKQDQVCPYCHLEHIIKYGHTKNGTQNYWCKDCKRKFNSLTGTIFSRTNLTYEQIEIFLQCHSDKISLRKTAKRMGANKNTAHLLRLKVNDSLKEIRQNIKLSGHIEADEIYKSINLKGTKPEKMPRISKQRTSNGTSTQGINKHKICIASAIDENDNAFLEIVGTGPITSNMVNEALVPKLENVETLITDCKSSYESVSHDNKWNLKQVKSKCYVDTEGNNLGSINSIHSGLSTFLSHFRGVSTKHAQGYYDWYIFDRYLNFRFEDNHNQVLLKNIIIKSTNIDSSTMYSNHSRIDFNDVYSDYCYNPPTTN